MHKPLYSIGHSNHSLEQFFELLRTHGIEVVVDVRSKPYSRYTTHFHGPIIQKELVKAGFKYLFLGKEIGGKPDDPALYDEDGHVRYDRIASSPAFAEGINRLQNGILKYTVALMCGEENPSGCHRRNLIAARLAEQGITVGHIRGDGRVETEDDLRRGEPVAATQLDLFQELM